MNEIPKVKLPGGPYTALALLRQTGLVSSNSDVRRVIQQHGVVVTYEVVDSEQVINVKNGMTVRVGNKYIQIEVDND